MKIYHGSKEEIKVPKYKGSGEQNDYGPAFYMTLDFEAASIWATKNNSIGVVNVYNVNLDNLKILDLTDKSKYSLLHWIALLVEHRWIDYAYSRMNQGRINWLIQNYHLNVDDYDVIIGYRADDAYFRFPKEFINGNIPLEGLEEIFKLGELGIQHVFISEKAIKRLHFEKSILAKKEYIGVYFKQVQDATSLFDGLLKKYENNSEGTRFGDLIK